MNVRDMSHALYSTSFCMDIWLVNPLYHMGRRPVVVMLLDSLSMELERYYQSYKSDFGL